MKDIIELDNSHTTLIESIDSFKKDTPPKFAAEKLQIANDFLEKHGLPDIKLLLARKASIVPMRKKRRRKKAFTLNQ